MDGRQFDRWTRVFGGTSRRGALRVLLAGLAAGPLVANARDTLAQVSTEKCGKQGDRCRDKSDCCNNYKCKNDKCRSKDNNNDGNCGKDGDRCNDNGDCCSNFRCKNDKCRSKDDNNSSCGKQGDRCKKSSDCCKNHRCKNDKCRKD